VPAKIEQNFILRRLSAFAPYIARQKDSRVPKVAIPSAIAGNRSSDACQRDERHWRWPGVHDVPTWQRPGRVSEDPIAGHRRPPLQSSRQSRLLAATMTRAGVGRSKRSPGGDQSALCSELHGRRRRCRALPLRRRHRARHQIAPSCGGLRERSRRQGCAGAWSEGKGRQGGAHQVKVEPSEEGEGEVKTEPIFAEPVGANEG
jgi:hypothetical protein